MNTTRILKWTCGALLAATALTSFARAAEVRVSTTQAVIHANELMWFRNLGSSYVRRDDPPDIAVAEARQVLHALVGRRGGRVFEFDVAAVFNGQDDTAHIFRTFLVNEEWVVPRGYAHDTPRELSLEGQHHFSLAITGATVAVGSGTYGLDVRSTVDLDYAFTGRALSLSDTAMAGQLDTRMRLDFVMELPDDIMIEDGREIGRSLTERKVQGPPAHFVSRLSCDIQTTDEELTGSWCRLQQAAWAWRLRLLREDRAGSLTGTDVTTLMDQDFRAVDEYLFDRRAKAVP